MEERGNRCAGNFVNIVNVWLGDMLFRCCTAVIIGSGATRRFELPGVMP